MALYFMEIGSVSFKPRGDGPSIDITVVSIRGNQDNSRKAKLEISGIPGKETVDIKDSKGLEELTKGLEVGVGPKPTSGSRVTVYYSNSYQVLERNVEEIR